MKRAIIIGATSGIGKELAKILIDNNYMVGLTGRRINLLSDIHKKNNKTTYLEKIDVTKTAQAVKQIQRLIKKMKGVDLFIISAGTGFINPDLDLKYEIETIDVNVTGFTAMANVAVKYFLKQKSGHLVGISSLAALRGGSDGPAYYASKAFVSNYLEGLRKLVSKNNLDITITDIQPGFIDTAMAKGDGLFWVAPPEKAAKQIFKVVKQRKKHAYITKRWRIIAWFIKFAPDWLYNRI